MATEYKLNYTASDINAKLSVIDGTKAYYDSTKVDERISESIVQSDFAQTDSTQPDYIKNKPEIDTEVAEGSEHLITSGGVYNALQNVGGSGDLTAGNLIKIENGVVSSTLGDGHTEIQETQMFETNYFANGDNATMPPFYVWQYLDNPTPFVVGDNVYLYCTDSIGNEKLIGKSIMEQNAFIDTVFGSGTQIGCKFNISSSWSDLFGLSTGVPIIDPTDSSITINDNVAQFIFLQNLNISNLVVFGAAQDYPNIKFRVCKDVSITNYVKLPDEALTEGNLIEINEGTISSTLGKGTTVTVNDTVFNCIGVPNGEFDSDVGIYIYEYTPSSSGLIIGDYINVTYTDSSNNVLDFTDVQVLDYDGYGEVVFINSSDTSITKVIEEGFAKIDESKIAFLFLVVADDESLVCNIVSSEDCVGSNIEAFKISQKTSYIKLPNEALSFDNEPTEGSENLVNSDTLFKAFQNVSPNLEFDDVPTSGSEKPVKSDGIYTAINNAIRDAIIESWGENY